jgi:hypothetical protein
MAEQDQVIVIAVELGQAAEAGKVISAAVVFRYAITDIMALVTIRYMKDLQEQAHLAR